VVSCRWQTGTFLADSILVVHSMSVGRVAWLRRSSGQGWGMSGVEVLAERVDGLECEGFCGFCAVEDDGLPYSKPVFDVSCSVGGYPVVDGVWGIADEEIPVGREYFWLLMVKMLEFKCCSVYSGGLSRFRVFAMDGGVSGFPHEEELLPNGGDNCGGPEESCFGVCGAMDASEVYTLETGPFLGHSTLE
jgi:hypothetical protein